MLKKKLMEILACPICKHYPLDLNVFDEKDEIVEGLITCQQCGRWYPIIDEIQSADFRIETNSTFTRTFGGPATQSYTFFFIFPPGGQSTLNFKLQKIS